MSKNSDLTSRQLLFLIKTAACFSGLIVASILLAPKAQTQNANVAVVRNTISVNGNYQPTPEPPKATLRGRVYYEDTGRAVKRTSLILIGKGGGGREVSGLTDNNGSFEIKNVPPGIYYAFVNAPGVVSPLAFADFSKPRESEGLEKGFENFSPIVVDGSGSDVNVEIPARRGGAISGRVMYSDGDPAIGIKVEILRKVENKYVPVIPGFSSIFSMMSGNNGGFQTDDRGVYRFAGLPNGEYVVKVTENVSHGEGQKRDYGPFGDSMFGSSSMLTIFYQDALNTEKAQKINVVAGQEFSEINIFIPERDLFNIEGRVINSTDKQPVKDVSISFRKKDEDTLSLFGEFGRRQQNSVSDEQGNWKLKELPKGTYIITVEPSNPYYYDESYMGSMNSNRAANTPPKPKLSKKIQEIVIEDKNLSEIVIELGYGATVSGTVRTENNAPMPNNIKITAMQEDSEITSSTTIYNYSNDGAYAANMTRNSAPPKPNHDFKMEGVATGKTFLSVESLEDDYYVKSAILNGVDLLSNPLELKEGDVLRNVQFIISKNVGTLKGTILDDSKQPAKNVAVFLVPTEISKRKNPNFRRSAFSKENGEFEIKAAPIEYAVIFAGKDFHEKTGEEETRWLEEAIKNAPKVTLKSNETEKISLTSPK